MRKYVKTPDWITLADEILAAEKPNYTEEKTGPNEYYFSEHTLNISILEETDMINVSFIKNHPELKAWVEDAYESWLRYDLPDDDLFKAWLFGNNYIINPDAFLEDITKNLVEAYRSQITETYSCSQCGVEVSEKYPFKHPQSLHRIGIAGIAESTQWLILCRDCLKTRR